MCSACPGEKGPWEIWISAPNFWNLRFLILVWGVIQYYFSKLWLKFQGCGFWPSQLEQLLQCCCHNRSASIVFFCILLLARTFKLARLEVALSGKLLHNGSTLSLGPIIEQWLQKHSDHQHQVGGNARSRTMSWRSRMKSSQTWKCQHSKPQLVLPGSLEENCIRACQHMKI